MKIQLPSKCFCFYVGHLAQWNFLIDFNEQEYVCISFFLFIIFFWPKKGMSLFSLCFQWVFFWDWCLGNAAPTDPQKNQKKTKNKIKEKITGGSDKRKCKCGEDVNWKVRQGCKAKIKSQSKSKAGKCKDNRQFERNLPALQASNHPPRNFQSDPSPPMG